MAKFNLIILSIAFSLMIIAGTVLAQESAPINFPIKELGNCRGFKECANFCDKEENALKCTDFAAANGMIKAEDAEQARKMLSALEEGGPGGCQSKDECEAYCENIGHIEECVAFAEEHGFLPPEELAEAKAVATAIKKGVNPPGSCKSKNECDAYCDDTAHIEECITFAEAAGFIKPEEAAMVRKTGGKGPGGCKGKDECDAYCNSPENMETCMNFALEYDLMPAEEKENAMKTLEAIKKGARPPNCRGKEECDQYCSQPENMEECTEFAIAAGFIPPEEAENVRRMAKAGIMGGPGGCKGKDECETFCDDLSHMTECVDFAEKAGFMTPEDAARARRMAERGINAMNGGPGGCKSQEDCEAFCNNPDNTETCINFAVEIGEMSAEEAENAKQGMKMMRQGGPGECKGEEECKNFCDDPAHQEECFNFAKENNLIPQEEIERMEQGMEMMNQREENQREEGEDMMFPRNELMPNEIRMPQEEFGPPENWQENQFAPQMEPVEPREFNTPQEFVPPVEYIAPPPAEEFVPPPPAELAPPPTEQPTSSLDSLLGIILYPLLSIF